jgi:hypothetical protein
MSRHQNARTLDVATRIRPLLQACAVMATCAAAAWAGLLV